MKAAAQRAVANATARVMEDHQRSRQALASALELVKAERAKAKPDREAIARHVSIAVALHKADTSAARELLNVASREALLALFARTTLADRLRELEHVLWMAVVISERRRG